jgi:hypothetical protein
MKVYLVLNEVEAKLTETARKLTEETHIIVSDYRTEIFLE